MSASVPAAFIRTWKVGTYTVTFTVPECRPGAQLVAVSEWEPHVPKRMTETEIADYIAGRNRALRDLCEELGITMAVLDV